MNAEHIIAHYLSDDGVVTPRVAAAVTDPHVRQHLYTALLEHAPQLVHGLLRHLLQEEVAFRNALWNGTATDDEHLYEGIYTCAFLLSRCADPNDTLLLWKAKHSNMDVGSALGAEYFVGAGLDTTWRFLEQCPAPEATQIAAYVRGWFSQPDAVQGQQDWEQARIDDIRSD